MHYTYTIYDHHMYSTEAMTASCIVKKPWPQFLYIPVARQRYMRGQLVWLVGYPGRLEQCTEEEKVRNILNQIS